MAVISDSLSAPDVQNQTDGKQKTHKNSSMCRLDKSGLNALYNAQSPINPRKLKNRL